MYNLPTDELFSLGISLLTNIALLFISMIAFRVFVVLAIHFSAKSLAVKDETPWLVFGAFFPLVVGFVYLCSRKSLSKTVPKFCTKCGATYPNDQVYCIACNSTDLVDYQIMNKKKYKKNSYMMLVVAVAMIVVFVSSLVQMSTKITDYVINHGDDLSSYFDDDYKNDYDDFSDFEDFYFDDDFYNDFFN